MIKAIIFDWNGVIVDSFELDHFIFLNRAKSLGVNVIKSKKYYKTMFEGNIIKKLLEAGFTEDQIKTSNYREIYKENLHRSKAFSGIKKILNDIKKDYIIGMVTANYRDVVDFWIKRDGFENIFDYILTKDDNTRKEENVVKFLEKFNLKKKEVVFVGDTVADILVCRNSGLKIIACTWGYHNEKELKKYNPDFIARNPNKLIKVLGDLDG